MKERDARRERANAIARAAGVDPNDDAGPSWVSARYWTAFRCYFMRGMTYRETGELLGVGGERARQLARGALLALEHGPPAPAAPVEYDLNLIENRAELSIRTRNRLRRNGIDTVEQLRRADIGSLSSGRGAGPVFAREVNDLLSRPFMASQTEVGPEVFPLGDPDMDPHGFASWTFEKALVEAGVAPYRTTDLRRAIGDLVGVTGEGEIVVRARPEFPIRMFIAHFVRAKWPEMFLPTNSSLPE